jgi:hypothetical protein
MFHAQSIFMRRVSLLKSLIMGWTAEVQFPAVAERLPKFTSLPRLCMSGGMVAGRLYLPSNRISVKGKVKLPLCFN